MAKNSPSTDTQEKEKKQEESRWAPKSHKEAMKQAEEFKGIYQDLSKEGVLKTLKEKRSDIFGDVKNFDEAMKILKEGKGETRDWIHHGLAERLEMNVGKTELQEEKKEEKEKQEKEVEKKKKELDTTDNKKEDKEKSEKEDSKKESWESEKKETEDDKKKDKKKKDKKKINFWKHTGNAIRYPFRASRSILKMLGRSVKTFGFEILNFPNPTRMKKVRSDYGKDMKSYVEMLKWNYKPK